MQLHEIAIEAPDGAAALELERRLSHLSPTTVARGRRWFVDVVTSSPDELEVVVREWLEQMGTPTTEMKVDGRSVHVSARRPPTRTPARATNREFIG